MTGHPPTLQWQGGVDGCLVLLDQTRLPAHTELLRVGDSAVLIDAIRRLAVRGAPAIGVAAAYGMVLGMGGVASAHFAKALVQVGERLIAARPTAVNLAWAVRRVQQRGAREATLEALLDEARQIHREDQELCARMGAAGMPLVRDGMTVLTHCNAGRLATAGDGTALAVLFAAKAAGRRFRVLADETRPLLQGARLTAYELVAADIPVQVLADGAAAGLIARGEVDLVLVGADRVAANGDFANKVGTYGIALACHAHAVPFYAVAPSSTFDLELADGTGIPIEERDADEVLCWQGQRLAAEGAGARNPAFDVTPARLLTGLITDRGRIEPVSSAAIKAALAGCR